jgi:cyclophilin family peptidyl-prolyl cis-trans isomerase
MNVIIKTSGIAIFLCAIVLSCSTSKPKTSSVVDKNLYVIDTEFGSMTIKLFDATPKHRDNFKKLVADTFYDGTLFHRIIPGFMIQGGDPTSKNAKAGQQLGSGNVTYTIDAEFVDSLIHKKGALAAARQGDNVNPNKNSSGSQFYIVQGVAVRKDMLSRVEQNINAARKRALASVVFEDSLNADLRDKFLNARTNKQLDSAKFYGNKLEAKLTEAMAGLEFKYSEKQIALYDSLGGAPHLDGGYTVFGEVISGLNIIDSIASAAKDGRNRPLEDIKMIIKKL